MQFIMVVVISAHLPTEHSLFHAHVPLSATEVLLLQDRVRLCGTVCWLLTVLGKLFTPIVPLFTKQQNW